MTKVVVTQEMAERALKVYEAYEPCVARNVDAMYPALLAALNPPPEPEIEVTKEMASAGLSTYLGEAWCGDNLIPIAAAYRAMRRLAPDFNKGPVEPQAADAPVQGGPLRFESTNPDKSASRYSSYGNTYWKNVGLKDD